MNTPWGKSHKVTKIETGLYWVTTAGHGGYMISKRKAEKLLPSIMLNNGFLGAKFGGYYCFEEDCAYAVVEYLLYRADTQCPNIIAFIEGIEPKYTMETYRQKLAFILNVYYPTLVVELNKLFC